MFIILSYCFLVFFPFSLMQEKQDKPVSSGHAVRDADSVLLWHTSDDSVVFDSHKKNGDVYIVISLDSALTLWHSDSFGCMGKRTTVVALQLLEKLHIKERTHSETLQLLGIPNAVYYDKLYINSVQEDGTFLILQYYIEQECQNGKPINPDHSSIRIIIHPRTNKVVGAS